MKLNNKIALITGGNSGIGFGIAESFKDAGATGAIIGRNPETLKSSEEKLDGSFISIQADVTQTDDLERMFTTLHQEKGKIDTLVVNAGGAIGPGSVGPFRDVTEADFDAMVTLNLKSSFFTIQKALPYLNNGASIILISSIAAHKAFAGMSVYASCKAGIRMLTKVLSVELLERNIRVNVISPGTIDTPVFVKMGIPEDHVEQAKQDFVNLIPSKKIGQPSDIGAAAVFLASDDASFIYGEEIIVDGGVINL